MTNENASAPTWQTMARRAWFALSCLWAAGWLLIALFQFAPWEATDKATAPIATLPEARRVQLDAIVQRMTDAHEPDENVRLVVQDFKQLYSVNPPSAIDYAALAEEARAMNDARARRRSETWTIILAAFALFAGGWFVRAFLRYIRTGRVWTRKTAKA